MWSPSGFESELRVSPKSVAVVLMASSGIIFSLGLIPSSNVERFQVLLLSALFLGLGAAIWKLEDWNPAFNRWFAVLAAAALIPLAGIWLDIPGALTLVVIPVALSAVLINLTVATIIATGETGLVLSLIAFASPGVSPGAAVGIVVSVWAILGVMYAIYYPVCHVAQWAWEHYQKAQAALEEARSRRAELEQAMQDLAHSNLQLARLNALAQELRLVADEARTAKEQLVANVSHELRTPLNMITGFSETILESPETYGRIPPTLMADLAVIHRNAKHLSELIDDVLALSQIEANQMVLAREPVNFHEIVEAAAGAVRPLYDLKGLTLETQVPEDLEVFCDPTRIREVILNLLSNAGRFAERGGVCVRAWKEDGNLMVSVADTGCGIAAEDLSKLFRPFQQVDGTIRRRYGGTGLGLSISKQFIELHGGKIWVESQMGIGTTFTFQIPISPPAPVGEGFLHGLNPDWEYQQRTHPPTMPKVMVHPRLVIVESGDTLQRLVTRYLEGVEVVPVANLEAAIEELAHVPAQALLINDISVSRVLERFGSSGRLPGDVPTIICSVPGRQQAAGALGVAERLVKPVSRQSLLDALERLQIHAGTVLIVDDEPDALHLFGRMLASAGRPYRVLLARDGREALSITSELVPDVILLDLAMSNMNGFQFLEVKSQDAALRDVPVIVISARDPAGQPIISSVMAVTRGEGLSAHQLLASIQALSKVLAPSSRSGDQAPTAKPAD